MTMSSEKRSDRGSVRRTTNDERNEEMRFRQEDMKAGAEFVVSRMRLNEKTLDVSKATLEAQFLWKLLKILHLDGIYKSCSRACCSRG